MDIAARLAGLRDQMKIHQYDAWLITGTDPHLTEYTPERWKTREWISGFSGSYGKVLVTQDKILLWTDTRYFIQAKEELNGTGIELMKDRVPDAVSLEEWLLINLPSGSRFGLDGTTISSAEAIPLASKLTAKGISFGYNEDLVDLVWIDRPPISNAPAFEHPIEFAGKSRIEKIDVVRKELILKKLDATVVSMLDDIAWILNLRGDDIKYIPVTTSYCYLDQKEVWLFIHPDKLSAVLSKTLVTEGIKIKPYTDFPSFCKRIANKKLQVDPVRTNFLITKTLSEQNVIDPSVSFTAIIKSVKDQKEIDWIKSAHVKDGTAMVNSLFWIFQTIGKNRITETSFGRKLNEFRNEQPLFKGDSFHPIVGFGPHGAIVHYHATEQTDVEITNDNLLLIDSGGQYLDGTTDLTRTICLGISTQKQKEDFTFCLKAHIALATAIFPIGTKGYSLDSITRKPLWDRAINYGHGTGHGIGYFLSVHEGPMSIRAEFNNEPIRKGHLLSNEPGIYREGDYGIRIENVLLCREFTANEFGEFLCFDTISFCPIDKYLIEYELLSSNEIDWINQYHETVFRKIAPNLSDINVLKWLKKQCEPLKEQS